MSIRAELSGLMKKARKRGDYSSARQFEGIIKQLNQLLPPKPTRPYRVKEGDNYWDVAKKELGSYNYAIPLMKANEGILSLFPGITLEIPQFGPEDQIPLPEDFVLQDYVPEDEALGDYPPEEDYTFQTLPVAKLSDRQKAQLEAAMQDPLTYELAQEVLFGREGAPQPLDAEVEAGAQLPEAEKWRLDKLARIVAGVEDARYLAGQSQDGGAGAEAPPDEGQRWLDRMLGKLGLPLEEADGGQAGTTDGAVPPESSGANGAEAEAGAQAADMGTEGQGEPTQGQGGSRQPILMKIGDEWLWGWWNYSANSFVADASFNPFLQEDVPVEGLVYRSDLSGAMVYLGKDENGEMQWGWFDPRTRKITPDQGANPVKGTTQQGDDFGWPPDEQQRRIEKVERLFTELEAALADDGTSVTIYVVQPGDTLWNIAQEFGVSLGELMAENEDILNGGDIIQPGQELRIPSGVTETPPLSEVPVEAVDGILDVVTANPEYARLDDETIQEYIRLVLIEATRYNLTAYELAYILASIHHESHWGYGMVEVYDYDKNPYEGDESIGNTEQGDGIRFIGRGFIQLTGRANYTQYTEILAEYGFEYNGSSVNLVNNPELATDPEIAAFIAVHGMVYGMFTGRRLSEYQQPDGGYDFVSARAILNPYDYVEEIPEYARQYLAELSRLCEIPGALPSTISCP